MLEQSQRKNIGNLFYLTSLFFLGCAVFQRLFMPGLSVDNGENALILLFCWGSLAFVIFDIGLEGKFDIHFPLLTLAAIIITFLPLLSTLWAIDKTRALVGSLNWLSGLGLFGAICYWGRKKEFLPVIFSTLVACVIIEILYAIYQHWIGLPGLRLLVAENPSLATASGVETSFMDLFQRKLQSIEIFGHFTLSNSLGGYLIMFLPILYSLTFQKEKFSLKQNWLTALLFLLAIYAFLLSRSRGSMLALAMIIAFYLSRKIFAVSSSKQLLLLSFFAFFGAILFYFACTHSHLFDIIGLKSSSLIMRFGYWLAGWPIFASNPLLGVGMDNGEGYYYQYKVLWAEEADLLHNCYLQWLVELGLIGFFALIFFAVMIFRLAFVHNDQEKKKKEVDFPANYVLHAAIFISCFLLFSFGRLWDIDPLIIIVSPYISLKNIAGLLEFSAIPIIFGLWLFFFRFFYKRIETIPRKFVMMGVMAFALHSFLDIDFYVPTLNQNFWILLAIIVADTPSAKKRVIHCNRFVITGMIIVTVVALLLMAFSVIPNLLMISRARREIAIDQSLLNQVKDPQQAREIANSHQKNLDLLNKMSPWDTKSNEINSWKHLQKAQRAARANYFLNNDRKYNGQTWRQQGGKWIYKAPLMGGIAGPWLEEKAMIIFEIYHPAQIELLLKEAERSLTTSIKYHPMRATGYFLRANFYQKQTEIQQMFGYRIKEQKSLQKATDDIEKCLQLYPGKAEFIATAGLLAEQKKQNQKAQDYYRRALYTRDMALLLWKQWDKGEREKILKKVA